MRKLEKSQKNLKRKKIIKYLVSVRGEKGRIQASNKKEEKRKNT